MTKSTTELKRDLLDDDGENRAVRSFLGMYQCGPKDLSVKLMKIHLEHSGFNGCWPDWVNDPANAGHLTKGGAQDWIRHLFALEGSSAAHGEQSKVEFSLVCKSCGADRVKEDCKGNRQNCDISGAAYQACSAEQSELPPLPTPEHDLWTTPGFTENQMREYARAALASAPAKKVPEGGAI